jgi:hypothetical protein
MSQVYQGSLTDNSTIKWLIDWTDPTAVKMVKSRSPELGGDYGWPIKAGETKTVSFKLRATGLMGGIPTYINARRFLCHKLLATDKRTWIRRLMVPA